MQNHQKYFHTFDKKGNITNEFFVVANNKDKKGYIKSGNERVIEARLSDAAFFWKKNKGYNLVKQISVTELVKTAFLSANKSSQPHLLGLPVVAPNS